MNLKELNEDRNYRFESDIPFHLNWNDLHLEPYGTHDEDWHPMSWFVDNVSWDDHEAIIRVWTAALALRTKYPEAPFEQCIETAIIWERG